MPTPKPEPSTVELVEIGLVAVPEGQNIRSEVGDVTELAASIKTHGIIEPLICRVTDARRKPGEGGIELVAGERRLMAAKLAKLTHVQVIVRELDDQQALEVMLIENLQREELSPMEEARAYRRLLDMDGVSQRGLAPRVGKSQAHISKRLGLLKLPESVQTQTDGGGVAIASAIELTKLAGDDAAMKKVARRVETEKLDEVQTRRLVEAEQRKKAVTKRMKEVRAELVKAGVPDERIFDGVAHASQPKGYETAKPIAKDGGFNALPIDPKTHVKKPCHLAVITRPYQENPDDVRVAHYCADRSKHPKVRTQDEEQNDARAAARKKQEEVEKKIAAVHQKRNEWVGQYVRKRLRSDEVLPFIAKCQLFNSMYLDDADEERAAVLLGLHPVKAKDARDEEYHDYFEPLVKLAEKSPADALRVLFAIAACSVESHIENRWQTWTSPVTGAYFDLLIKNGYKLTEYEQKKMEADLAEQHDADEEDDDEDRIARGEQALADDDSDEGTVEAAIPPKVDLMAALRQQQAAEKADA